MRALIAVLATFALLPMVHASTPWEYDGHVNAGALVVQTHDAFQYELHVGDVVTMAVSWSDPNALLHLEWFSVDDGCSVDTEFATCFAADQGNLTSCDFGSDESPLHGSPISGGFTARREGIHGLDVVDRFGPMGVDYHLAITVNGEGPAPFNINHHDVGSIFGAPASACQLQHLQ